MRPVYPSLALRQAIESRRQARAERAAMGMALRILVDPPPAPLCEDPRCREFAAEWWCRAVDATS